MKCFKSNTQQPPTYPQWEEILGFISHALYLASVSLSRVTTVTRLGPKMGLGPAFGERTSVLEDVKKFKNLNYM